MGAASTATEAAASESAEHELCTAAGTAAATAAAAGRCHVEFAKGAERGGDAAEYAQFAKAQSEQRQCECDGAHALWRHGQCQESDTATARATAAAATAAGADAGAGSAVRHCACVVARRSEIARSEILSV